MLKCKEALEQLAQAFRVLCLEEDPRKHFEADFLEQVCLETEEIVSFLKFKIRARPESFIHSGTTKRTILPVIDHYFSEEANEGKKKVEIKTVGVSPTVEKEEAKVPSNVHCGKEKRDQNNNSEKKACPLLKIGKCKHGWSGTKIDQGKICSYNHPKVCKRQEMYGRCYDKYCSKFHLKICREYMNTLNCGYGKENCKFFHPTRLKEPRLGHEGNNTYSMQGNSRIFHGKNQSYYRQGYQMQHPFLEQKTQGTVQEILRRLEQLEMLQKNWIWKNIPSY